MSAGDIKCEIRCPCGWGTRFEWGGSFPLRGFLDASSAGAAVSDLVTDMRQRGSRTFARWRLDLSCEDLQGIIWSRWVLCCLCDVIRREKYTVYIFCKGQTSLFLADLFASGRKRLHGPIRLARDLRTPQPRRDCHSL